MMMLDQAGAVRAGEELDPGAIGAWLSALDPGLAGTIEIAQFPGGASNLTYLIRCGGSTLVLRRPPFGQKAKSAHDMVREARVMQALRPRYPFVPDVIGICEDPTVIGSEFYVMAQITGIIPRQTLPPALGFGPGETATLCRNVIDTMIALHALDVTDPGLAAIGRGEGYVQRQIDGWSDRYRKAMTPDAAGFTRVMAWLGEKMPRSEVRISVIHNDFRFDNVVLDPSEPTRVIGVLDWEMATLGDPLMDLGNSLAYWVEAEDDPIFLMTRRQPTHEPGMMRRADVIRYYGEKTGLPVDRFDFYAIYGLFRLAVILQQIYYRYHHGQTRDQRFAGFITVANYLEKRCEAMIDRSVL